MKTGTVAERLTSTKRVPPAQILESGEADHDEVGHVLVNTLRTLDRERFYTSLLDPDFRPEHRLIARVGGRLASHVLMTNRSIQYDSVALPMTGLVWLGTVPEYRGRGLAEALIRQAVKKADSSKISLLGLTTRTTDPYENLGWVTAGASNPVTISSRNLPTEEMLQQEVAKGGWTVRPWRQVELSDLMRIYNQQLSSTHIGSVVRSEAYWRWIVGMKMAHAIWVACQGDHVRGYAFVKDHHVLEIGADSAVPDAFDMLLCRIRAESLERAYPDIIMDVPPDHPVLDHLTDWPGQASSRLTNPSNMPPNNLMIKISNVALFLNQIAPELDRRARAANIQSGELGLSVGSNRWTLRWDENTPVAVECGRSGRKTITLGERALLLLALGQESIETLVLAGLASFQHTSTAAMCEVLFPKRSLWRSILDRYTY
jgi:predicted N-acetyltransferase YhbS